jgi:hypothetical protein
MKGTRHSEEQIIAILSKIPFRRARVRNAQQLSGIDIVGQAAASKGHDDLLDAFVVAHQKHANSELHVFGTGDPAYRSKLENKSIGLGVANPVRWHESYLTAAISIQTSRSALFRAGYRKRSG